MSSNLKYFLSYWDNGCVTMVFDSLDTCHKYIRDNQIYHYDLVDNRGFVYHAVFQ